MTMNRANPFANLDEFQAKPVPKPVAKEEIERLAEATGFSSRQPAIRASEAAAQRQSEPRKKGRRYTTGRNQQINIKATAATIDRLYQIADARHLPLGEILELAIAALDRPEPGKGQGAS